MAENSKIEWCDHTFNPWTGCTKISSGCDHCYAETMSRRNPAVLGSWAPGADRKRTSGSNWRQPIKWNAKARAEGRRYRVFCASMADVFDNQAPETWRADLWALIAATPHLDWLLLTKRPQNIARMLPADWSGGWSNVWLGATVENQEEADRRIPPLLAVPAALRFLSCEPLLEPVTVRSHWLVRHHPRSAFIGWIIAGGESGPGARPMHPDWARSLRDQCAAAGVPFHFKQWGAWVPTSSVDGYWHGPKKNERNFPAADGISMLRDGRICMRDFSIKEHNRRIILKIATTTRAIEVDCQALEDFHRSVKDVDRSSDNPLGYEWMYRVGKRAAGRLLDGRTHDALPQAREAARA